MEKIKITKENLKEFLKESKADPREFRKKVTTMAIRMEGQFQVETSEGPIHCPDGWLAVDQRGYPYPIPDDEFQLIYEKVEK